MLDTKKMYTILIVFIVAMFFLVTGAVFYAKDSANSAEPVKEDSIEAPIEEQSPDITESDAVENTEQKQEETEVSVVPQQAETLNKEAYVLYLDHLLDKKWESICKNGSAELVASYEVAVSRDGRINSYKLNESGVNYAKYKNILTRVIKNLAPLKPLPNEFAGSEAVFKLEFMNEGTVLTSFIDPNSPSSSFTAPVPKSAPSGKTLSTGPIGGTSAPTGSKTGSSGSSKGSAYAPRPSLSPSAGGGSNSPLARGSSGSGNIGNPGGGGGAPGIDALREPDFGPYMRELQRRIKLNWDPPKGNESKRVILLFKIAKDGRLLSCRVHKSSGLPSADQAALKAVELTAPFRPLPADFKGQSIDIQFTFDYNVFGAKIMRLF